MLTLTTLMLWERTSPSETYTVGAADRLSRRVASSFKGRGTHFVVRDGGTYEVSKLKLDGFGTLMNFSVGGSDVGLERSSIDPSNFTRCDPSETGLGMSAGAFKSMTFSNVTGVGLTSEVNRANAGDPTLNVSSFEYGISDLKVIPEPGVFGLLTGFIAISSMAVRRRKATA